MSGGSSCKCLERLEPITVAADSNRPGRLWRVINYKCNYSAFNGYHYTSSDYSSCTCLRCGAVWRTKSDYAGSIKSYDRETELHIGPGYQGYETKMATFGRAPYKRPAIYGSKEEAPQ